MPRRRLSLLLLGLCCGRAPKPAPEPSSACVLTQQELAPGDTVAVLLGEPVDPAHAPLPTNDAEALVFRQLYQTLVRIDCDGRVRPGLATSWSNSGLQWSFTLRPDAAFWDGSRLDAATVLDGWRATDGRTAVEGVRSDGRTLTVFLSSPQPLSSFAGPALRLVRHVPGSAWVLGTGPWRPDAGPTPLTITSSASGPRPQALRFEVRPGADPRDLIDAGTALLVTRDRGTVAYATGLAGWADHPLPWDRVYVLLSPWPAASDESALDAVRTGLARAALPGDARPADSTALTLLPHCASDSPGPPAPRAPRRRRVVYHRDDAVARALAERLVARTESDLSTLLGAPVAQPGAPVTAIGITGESWHQALWERADLAVVLPVSHPATKCGTLASAAEWGAVVPLVETRPHGLIRRGAARVVRDRDGLVVEPEER